jgi:hypothetical protein
MKVSRGRRRSSEVVVGRRRTPEVVGCHRKWPTRSSEANWGWGGSALEVDVLEALALQLAVLVEAVARTPQTNRVLEPVQQNPSCSFLRLYVLSYKCADESCSGTG